MDDDNPSTSSTFTPILSHMTSARRAARAAKRSAPRETSPAGEIADLAASTVVFEIAAKIGP